MDRKLYFCGSITGGRDDVDIYKKIITYLKVYGTVFTVHVGESNLNEEGKDVKEIHNRDIAWLKESHAIVAEVTQPSLGVGYELGRGVVLSKPILCLFRSDSGKSLSPMIDGAQDGKRFFVERYKKTDEIKDILKNFFGKLG